MSRRRKSNRSSIVEVSREASVSIATVSRVLNGHPHVSAEAAAAVHAAVRRTGYRASANVARQGKRTPSVTGHVAVLFPDTDQEVLRTPLSGKLMHGIDEELRRQGLTMVVAGLQADLSPPVAITRRDVIGVIVRGSRMAAQMHGLLPPGMPSVWVFEAGYQAAFAVDMICEDNAMIGLLAARRLEEHGHRRVCVINLEPEHASLNVRRLFFVDAAQKFGLDVRCIVEPSDRTAAVLDALAALPPAKRPTGVFVPGTDGSVIEVGRGMESRGMRLGKDVELISVNNDINRLWALNRSLANIDIQPEHIGQAAVDTLLWRLTRPDGVAPRRIVIAPKIVEGNPAVAKKRPT